jgi:hypothetical protein
VLSFAAGKDSLTNQGHLPITKNRFPEMPAALYSGGADWATTTIHSQTRSAELGG